jgi:hypothetical protein
MLVCINRTKSKYAVVYLQQYDSEQTAGFRDQ